MTVFNQQNQTVTGMQFNSNPFPKTPPLTVLQRLEQALLALQTDKPNDRSPVDRHFAVAINDLEHLIGYFKTYIHPNKE